VARSRERALIESGCAVSHQWPLGRLSLLSSRTRHLFAASGSAEPSPKIEFVFSASPETIRGEPPEFDLLRSVAIWQGLAVCARNDPDVFSFMGRFLGCRRASELLGGHEILLSAFDCEQIGNDLPRHCEGGAVAITSLHLFFVDQSQLVALSRGELGGLYQHENAMYFHLTNTQVIIVSFALVLIIIFALAAFFDKRRRAVATRRDFATNRKLNTLRQSSGPRRQRWVEHNLYALCRLECM
jgi:hypothetical protein